MEINKAIETLEANGYIVKAEDNMSMGELNKECPVVYKIMRSDYSTVYGAGSVGPDQLADYVATLVPAVEEAEEVATETVVAETTEEKAIRRAKEIEWDKTYNEGGEGYNPYR